MRRFIEFLLIIFIILSSFLSLSASELTLGGGVNVNKNSMGVEGTYIPVSVIPPIPPFPGWSYGKSVTLSRPSGAVSNYQMRILIGESSGATGEDVDCNSHVQTDFDDLRFTNSSLTVLDYWIESITGATPNQLATVWVEFDTINTANTTFYMYYGNAGAASYTNGANTFITYDDFERGVDTDPVGGSWTVVTGSVTISTTHDIGDVTGFTGTRGCKYLGNVAQPDATIPQVAGNNTYSIMLRVYKEDAGISYVFHGNGTKLIFIAGDSDEKIYYNDGSYHDTGSTISINTWHLWEFKNVNFTAATYNMYQDGVLVMASIPMYTSVLLNGVVRLAGSILAGNHWIDNFIVRNWRPTEPTFGAWSSEQAV